MRRHQACSVFGMTKPALLLALSLLAGCSVPAFGFCDWSSAERPMSGHPNVNGCWMVRASGEAAVEPSPADACQAATSCLVVPASATVWAYASATGDASFTADDVPCDAVCPDRKKETQTK